MRVDIWSDITCPFCYIVKKRLERVATEMDVTLDIHWHSFQLDPDAPTSYSSSNSERLAKKYHRSIESIDEMQEKIADMAAEEGIDFQWQKAKAGNSFNAHRIIHLAQSKNLADEAQEAFFKAYLTEGLAIGEREVLDEVASRIGLDHGEVEDVLESNAFAEFVKYDQDLAQEPLKITTVPFLVFEQRVALAGAQPAQVFNEVIAKVIHDQKKIENTPPTEDQ